MTVKQTECFRLEQRSGIRFLLAEKCKPCEIYTRLFDVYRESVCMLSLSFSQKCLQMSYPLFGYVTGSNQRLYLLYHVSSRTVLVPRAMFNGCQLSVICCLILPLKVLHCLQVLNPHSFGYVSGSNQRLYLLYHVSSRTQRVWVQYPVIGKWRTFRGEINSR